VRYYRLSVTLVLFSACANAIPQNYTLDPLHSSVTWQVSHFGFSNPSGKWYATGNIIYDESKPQNSKVTVQIDIAKIVTGIPKLDYNLLGSGFLDARKYPVALFVSKSIKMTSTTTAEVSGNLTLHGVTIPLALKVIFNKTGIDPITNKKTIGFSATTTVARSDFGITTYIPDISDEVKLDIQVEAMLNDKTTD
ncbi:MAG: polyisoprenoid-binding protein, partial [Burkholderiales bacterium]|nr:polyisoprenoid-binding protein [Burkholderiales bacterium]